MIEKLRAIFTLAKFYGMVGLWLVPMRAAMSIWEWADRRQGHNRKHYLRLSIETLYMVIVSHPFDFDLLDKACMHILEVYNDHQHSKLDGSWE